jgi:hypothetical protein
MLDNCVLPSVPTLPPNCPLNVWHNYPRSPDITHGEPVWERVLRVNDVGAHARNPRLPAEGRDNGPVLTYLRLPDQPPCEDRAQDSFVIEILVQPQLASCI